MANDNVITSVQAVESYAKNIKNIDAQVKILFKKLESDTNNIGSVWKDKQFEAFKQALHQDILVKVQQVSAEMISFAQYTEQMCKLNREVQALRRK